MFERSTTRSISCICSGTGSPFANGGIVILMRPLPGSARYTPHQRRTSQCALLWLQPRAQQKRLSLTHGSALHPRSMGLLWPRLTPDGTSSRLAATVALLACPQVSPGNAHLPSRLCPPHLRNRLLFRYWTLEIVASSSGGCASYAIPVRQASALPSASFPRHLAISQLPFS